MRSFRYSRFSKTTWNSPEQLAKITQKLVKETRAPNV